MFVLPIDSLARALESAYLMNPPHSSFTEGSSKYANPAPISPATTATTRTPHSPHNEDVAPDDSYDRSCSSIERNGVPDRIFQILRNDDTKELMCSYPKGGYDPKHLRGLAHSVSMAPYSEASGEEYTKTSCTRRLECSRSIPDPRTGSLRKVRTLYIPHGQVIFACHRMDPDEREENRHYHPVPAPTYDDSQAGLGALHSRNRDEVPPTPSSYSSREQPLHGYNSYPRSSYGRTNSHYSGSWPPLHENRADWRDSSSTSGTSYPGYGARQTYSFMLHSRMQQTQSLRSTQSSQSLYGQAPTSSSGSNPPETRNPLPYSRASSVFATQAPYPAYGHSQSGNSHQWGATNGSWEEHNSALLHPRESRWTLASRYQDPDPHSQQISPSNTPISAQSSQQHLYNAHISTSLQLFRIQSDISSQYFFTGMKPSADDILYSSGSASDSRDEHSAPPSRESLYKYNAPGSMPHTPVQAYRKPGGSRTKVNPPPGVMKCVSCGIDNSPEWRKDQNGVKPLCNA
ncbi:hypothetical protein FRC00_010397 [Tulasnella sp. 408]|nr:hypothetical protein FRC00_010397 [Tulasnella sp. 408]